jgi:NitT/TauT family transport system substrate-binding protein
MNRSTSRDPLALIRMNDPARTRLLKAGARILFDNSNIPGEVVDVLVIRRDQLDKHARHMESLIRCWCRTLDYLHVNPRDAASRMAARTELRPAEFLESLNGVRFVSRNENQSLLGGPQPTLSATAERLARVMMERRLLYKEVNVKSLFKKGK